MELPGISDATILMWWWEPYPIEQKLWMYLWNETTRLSLGEGSCKDVLLLYILYIFTSMRMHIHVYICIYMYIYINGKMPKTISYTSTLVDQTSGTLFVPMLYFILILKQCRLCVFCAIIGHLRRRPTFSCPTLTTWYGNFLRIIGPLWWESTGHWSRA